MVLLDTSATTIRWGLVGAGSVCEIKSGPAFYKAPGSSLVAVMRRNKSAAEDFAKRHNVPRFYSDIDDLLKDPEVDAVYVATPPGSHRELALKVCAAGKPCYMEKPMARTYAECTDMIKAFQDAKLPLYVGYYRRYLPKFVYVKSVIDSGTIGRVTSINLRLLQGRHKFEGEEVRADWRVEASNAGGGLFMDLGSHQLDLLDHLVGPLENARGTARRLRPKDNLPSPAYAVEDVVSLTFDTPSGAMGTACWNFCSGVWEDAVDIVGEFGSVSFSCFNNKPVRLEVSAKKIDSPAATTPTVGAEGGRVVLKNGTVELSAAGRIKRLKYPEVVEHQAEQPEHVHQPLVEAVLRDLARRATGPEDELGPTCHSTGDAAARTALVMDQALEGFYGGTGSRDKAFWETPESWAN